MANGAKTATQADASATTGASSPRMGGLRVTRLVSEQTLAYGAVIAAVLLGCITFVLLSSEDFLTGQGELVGGLLAVDIIALGLLVFLVARQVLRLLGERRKKLAGYRLHLRLVTLFGVITIFPALIVVGFSFFALDYSLRGWFSERISTAINESVTIADSYLEEHTRSVEGQVLAIANDINREAASLLGDRRRFENFLTNQAAVRNLSEAIVVDSTGRVLANSRFAYGVTFSSLDEDFFEQTRGGGVAISRVDITNRIRAGVRLNQLVDAYLLVGRFIDPRVTGAVAQTKTAVSEYQTIDLQQINLKVSFAVLFGLVALLLLLGSIWVGLNFATAIIEPLSGVISVAEEVSAGNLASRVAVPPNDDEIARLGLSFNRMLDDINKNRLELVEANRQLDSRREFTEAVLGGVASGVIGIDSRNRITLPNAVALEMLGLKKMEAIGAKLDVLVPEFAPLIAGASKPGRRNKEQNLEIKRDGVHVNLLARITTETVENRIVGYVVTFENVSDLLDAQRKAAWADVARRIAHEIKNPLTPIQLAAERLGEKYLPEDEKGREGFANYIETIKRQVGDIGRLVNEFSSFARMPIPDMQSHNLVEIARGQAGLFGAGYDRIPIWVDSKGRTRVDLVCDDAMMRQVVTNLVQNSVDAIRESKRKDGRILVEITSNADAVTMMVADNGPGLPQGEGIDLTAPYTTFRAGGTGLGLAIVRKIIEDHDGVIELGNASHPDYDGAAVKIILPVKDRG